MSSPVDRLDDIACALLDAHDDQRQIAPITKGVPEFDLALAYKVAANIREIRTKRGARVLGRKIGFTNQTIWPEYGVFAPVWGYVYDTTLYDLASEGAVLDLSRLIEPRIEPEIAFGLCKAPEPGMDEATLLSCVDFIAHGFEIVQSLFPGWHFRAADTIAAFGLHGALVLGPKQPVISADWAMWFDRLANFEITLLRDAVAVDHGQAMNVLGGGPLKALRHLVELLANDPVSPPLDEGEIITTGTLTRAIPIQPGETWSTKISGLPLAGISLTLR